MIQHRPLPFPNVHPLTCDTRSDTSTDADQHQPQHEFLSSGPSLPCSRVPLSKAKSSLCKNYTEKGFCPYGKKCQFAHGPEELRINMETNRSYKTKGCHAFAKKGYCCYGERCNFIHEQTQTWEDNKEKWDAIFSNHRQTLRVKYDGQESRLMRLLGN